MFFSFRFISLYIALAFLQTSDVAGLTTGSTVDVNGIFYFVPGASVATISGHGGKDSATFDEELVPITVITNAPNPFTAADLQTLVANFSSQDDVFNVGFLQAVFINVAHGNSSRSSILPSKRELEAFGIKHLISSRSNSNNVTDVNLNIPEGPYFMSSTTGEVFQAFRLYSDIQGAFTEGLIADGDGNYSVLSASIPGAQSQTIGVPSRLYFTKTEALPLAGVRLGVKDIYNISGVRTSCGNRAFYELYGEATVTATAIQKLIDAGVVIIGKMKTSQFANGETATGDWVDYHSPYNPRGDGYQDPSSSSSGPGAGIAAYPWLDLGIGSDTGGSIRGPSQVNGAFGNRPSHGFVSLDGVMPLSPLLDTAGFITLSPPIWKAAAQVLYSNLSIFTSFPTKIFTANFPTRATTEADTILLTFLSQLETFLNTTSEVLDYNSLWLESSQAASLNNITLSNLLNVTYASLIGKQQFTLVRDPFFADYAAANANRTPFIDPQPMARWAFSQSPASSTLDLAIANKTIFMDWWNSTILVPTTDGTCSNAFLLYPGAEAQTDYRNKYLSPPVAPLGLGIGRISPFTEVPDMVIPVGQASYNSTITLQSEVLPVAVDFLVAKGCDHLIIELANQLVDAGIIKVPMTGSRLFP